jgi:hypothetical protein
MLGKEGSRDLTFRVPKRGLQPPAAARPTAQNPGVTIGPLARPAMNC